MGLADLKKKKKQEEPGTPPPVTIDEFINDAELYALGHPKVVSPDRAVSPPEESEQSEEAPPGRGIYKKATYSMTMESVEHLSKIAEQDGFNRSQLVRLFTHYCYQLPEEERALIYARFHELLEQHRK